MMNTYGIYIRADDRGRVVAVSSEGLLESLDGWVRVGEYESDVPYAQGGAFGEPIMTDGGAWRYKLEDGNVVERSQEEMDADDVPPDPLVSDTELALVELAGMLAEQQAAIVELAALIGGSAATRAEDSGAAAPQARSLQREAEQAEEGGGSAATRAEDSGAAAPQARSLQREAEQAEEGEGSAATRAEDSGAATPQARSLQREAVQAEEGGGSAATRAEDSGAAAPQARSLQREAVQAEEGS